MSENELTIIENFLENKEEKLKKIFENSIYYLYTGEYYWTMSSTLFNGSIAGLSSVNPNGNADSILSVKSYGPGARPVLNLSSDVLKNGNGTASDPYHA